ncbi:MAG: ATP-binding protein, partial [Actinomycetota bacterium]
MSSASSSTATSCSRTSTPRSCPASPAASASAGRRPPDPPAPEGRGHDSVIGAGLDPYLWALDAAHRDAVSGQGGVVLVTGEAGIGKTALVRSFAAAADADVR